MTTCRRCSECVGAKHHWLSNSQFGADDNTAPEYECKHCDATGYECPGCDGYGCTHCKGDGVLESITHKAAAAPTPQPERKR